MEFVVALIIGAVIVAVVKRDKVKKVVQRVRGGSVKNKNVEKK